MKLRFTIRDLFWLVLVAAICGCWWLDRSRLASELRMMHADDNYTLSGPKVP